MKLRFSNSLWGIFLLLAAAFILINHFKQFSSFAGIGPGGIIAGVLALAFLVHCIAHLRFARLPIPLAVLYIFFSGPLGLPDIPSKALILASVLASIGLYVLLPARKRCFRHEHRSHSGGDCCQQIPPESCGNDNNPVISTNFGFVSRHLHADSLETVSLNCNFGTLEIFLDQAQLSGNGAEAAINCSFGAVELNVPRHWLIIDRISCKMGAVNMDKHFASQEGAPRLTLAGSVSFGGIEVRAI
ncbi:MAG: hypothetical protein LBH43_14435 [Treponema sp.]|jgi:hypothetical protein|nr:hypothetical protein [Treponema sp.]